MSTHATLLLSLHDAATIRLGLQKAAISGPHSFIRELDADYDREVLLEQWLRPLAEQDDLRYSVQVNGQEYWVLLETLPWDSTFFSRGMARLNALVKAGECAGLREDGAPAAAALDAVLAIAKSRGIDYVLAPASPNDLHLLRSLAKTGFELIETRCHYHRSLTPAAGQRHATRMAGPHDVASLARTAREMVNPYDRFHADIAMSDQDADRMMERWIEASIVGGFADTTIVPDVDEPEAFCTAKYHREHWKGWNLRLAQPVLSAVSSRHKGWYVRIISELDEHLRSIGAEHSFLITQITNNAVIRSWEKLGYRFGKGEHIFRRLL
ncbi:hypothetical protein V1318_06650 [Lysobacter sp. CCNWLW3]|uniref:hypothetical protein n=1 Tax=unclassified Lysobacter TaxID=2635362 RepID=UPI002FCEEA6E